MYNEYPKEFLELINAPGKFKQKANVNSYVEDKDLKRMDASYIADPDYKIVFRPTVCNGEHQSTPVDDSKLEIMGDYAIQQIHDENLPQLSWIASHIPKNKHKTEFEYTKSSIIRPVFLDLGEEDNRKRLSSVRNIISQQDYISIKDALNIGITVLFAPRHHACEITETAVELYTKIAEQLPKKLEYVLYSVLKVMIDAYFDDENEYGRIIEMINRNTSAETIERFESIEIMQNDLEIANNNLETAHNDLEIANNNLETAENRIQELESAQEDYIIAQNRIQELEAKVKELEGQLDSK